MDRMKVAISGLSYTQTHIRFFTDAPEIDLILVQDINEDLAKRFASNYNVPVWSTDFNDILASGADIVFIATPNHLHADMAVAALSAGKHVLSQKPIASTVADGARMVSAAKASGKTLGIYQERLNAQYQTDLRKIVTGGYLGKIVSAHIRSASESAYNGKWAGNWRMEKELTGGGALMMIGIHHLNNVQWLLNDSLESVMGYADTLYSDMTGEDIIAASGKFTSGALFTLQSSYCSLGSELCIYGTEGRMQLLQKGLGEETLFLYMEREFAGDTFSYQPVDDATKTMQEIDLGPIRSRRSEWEREHNQVRDYVRAVMNNQVPTTTGEMGLRDLATAHAMYRSAQTGALVNVADFLEKSRKGS